MTDKFENNQDEPKPASSDQTEKQEPKKKDKEYPFISYGISLGMCFGVIFVQVIFDNLALCLRIGMCLGAAIGAMMDSANKKRK